MAKKQTRKPARKQTRKQIRKVARKQQRKPARKQRKALTHRAIVKLGRELDKLYDRIDDLMEATYEVDSLADAPRVLRRVATPAVLKAVATLKAWARTARVESKALDRKARAVEKIIDRATIG